MSAPRLEPRSAGMAVLPLRVGIQGEAGCFSHAALRDLLGAGGEAVFHHDFAGALDALASGQVERLLLPVHNSLAGVVAESLAAIASHDVRVVGEAEIQVRLVMAALPGASRALLTEVASHPMALRQCRRLLAHHPGLEPVEVFDTAGGARLLAESGRVTRAAITSEEAALLHGLEILERDVQDRLDNVTRFWLLARRQLSPASLADRLDGHLGRSAREGRLAALRGAIGVAADTVEALDDATATLLAALLDANGITTDDVVSAIFTATPDLTATFPATSARKAGWDAVPLLCTSEMNVAHGLPRCLRVLLHVRMASGRKGVPVYLRGAEQLRPDLS